MFISCSFEAKLPEIFKDVHDSYEKIEGRLKAEQFKVRSFICPSFVLNLSFIYRNRVGLAQSVACPPLAR